LHMLNLMTKTSSSEFYETLEQLTDNIGLGVPPNHLQEFMHATSQWQTVCLYKLHGRGQYPNGCDSVQMGDLAVICPACPYPNINLPLDYELAHPSKR
ncbi:hypothetical protein BT96DRAFT_832389, partial [Gymnopus androsaceus JB14]